MGAAEDAGEGGERGVPELPVMGCRPERSRRTSGPDSCVSARGPAPSDPSGQLPHGGAIRVGSAHPLSPAASPPEGESFCLEGDLEIELGGDDSYIRPLPQGEAAERPGEGARIINQGSFPVGKVAPARQASRGRKGLNPVQRSRSRARRTLPQSDSLPHTDIRRPPEALLRTSPGHRDGHIPAGSLRPGFPVAAGGFRTIPFQSQT